MMDELWLRVCALLDVDPVTVKMPQVLIAQPEIIDLFGGGVLMYHPGDNKILLSGDYTQGQLAHEFAHAVCWQSEEYNDGDNESRCQWVEANI